MFVFFQLSLLIRIREVDNSSFSLQTVGFKGSEPSQGKEIKAHRSYPALHLFVQIKFY